MLDMLPDPFAQLRAYERSIGAMFLPVGLIKPFRFPEDDWRALSIVSALKNEIRLVLLVAKRPRSGALRRLISEIQEAGLVPVACDPMSDEVRDIYRRWGWRQSYYLGIKEEWRPPLADKSGMGRSK